MAVGCGRRKGVKDDIRAFGLRNWKDRIAATYDREGVVSEQGEGKISSSVLSLECVLSIHFDC